MHQMFHSLVTSVKSLRVIAKAAIQSFGRLLNYRPDKLGVFIRTYYALVYPLMVF
jgi:hypothetical protein